MQTQRDHAKSTQEDTLDKPRARTWDLLAVRQTTTPGAARLDLGTNPKHFPCQRVNRSITVGWPLVVWRPRQRSSLPIISLALVH